ncbi:IMP-specific 5'-nucleotidase-domain-containing protein [Haematococcus lacustris]
MTILLQGWQLGWLAAGPAPPVSPSSSYWELLNNPEQESTIFGNRARSAMDSNDYLIDYMRRMHETHTCEEVMLKMERWIAEHRQDPRRSRLRRLVPQLGNFFTSLRLVDAFREYDAVFALSRRKYIPPNFAELRHIVNIAQVVHASADAMKLITFDADGTLYADGSHFQQDNAMIAHIINLMRCNVHVGIVTAAGYPGEAHKFESRLAGLLETFRKLKLPAEIINRFHVMGGECNYLLRVTADTKSLEFVPEPQWQTPPMQCWKEEALLVESAQRLNLPISLIRKNRSVGIVPQTATIYEVLEDIALTVQNQLVSRIPFCAFNGGNDVFVDAGNKSLGLQAMMAFTGAMPHETLHVGDRFTLSGNDTATRDVCSVLWVANPEETGFFIRMLLKDIRRSRWQPYIE